MATEGNGSRINRRDFLTKTAAGAAGIGLAASLARSGTAHAAVSSNLAIRRVSTPPYEVVGPYQRFNEKYTIFVQVGWNQELIARENEVKASQPLQQKMEAGEPGYTREEVAFYLASWNFAKANGNEVNSTNVGWNSWKPIGGNTAMLYGMPKLTVDNPARLSRMIKKIGRFWGAGDVGITRLDERWVYSEVSRYGPTGLSSESSAIQKAGQSVPVIVSDTATTPETTPERVVIPKSMNNVIVMVIPHRFAAQMTSPSGPASAAVGLGYSMMQFLGSQMAEYIRALGYQAIPCGNDTMLSIPTAIDAGLGELGRNGLLIHPVFGPALRICKVITDLPLALDSPIEFGVREFCRTCKKCAVECPSSCISDETEPTTEARCDANNPGVLKWPIQADLCHIYWGENGVDCSACQRSCPFTKRDLWTHGVTKSLIANVPGIDPIWVKMDDLMGFGFREDPTGYWEDDEL